MNFAITYFERFNFFLIVPCGPLAILLVAYFSTSSSTRCYGSTVTCVLRCLGSEHIPSVFCNLMLNKKIVIILCLIFKRFIIWINQRLRD
jgi:hypothetical protein